MQQPEDDTLPQDMLECLSDIIAVPIKDYIELTSGHSMMELLIKIDCESFKSLRSDPENSLSFRPHTPQAPNLDLDLNSRNWGRIMGAWYEYLKKGEILGAIEVFEETVGAGFIDPGTGDGIESFLLYVFSYVSENLPGKWSPIASQIKPERYERLLQHLCYDTESRVSKTSRCDQS